MDELVAHMLRFRRPDVVLEPAHERDVVGDAAHERHRRVAMQVHQAGDQRVALEHDDFARLESRARLRARQERHDAAGVDRDGVIGKRAARLHRNDVRGRDQRVDRLHGSNKKPRLKRGFLPIPERVTAARP